MPVTWFLLGLGIGLGVWLWSWTQFNPRLRSLMRKLQANSWSAAIASTSQLTRTIAEQGKQITTLETQLQGYEQILRNAPIGYLQVDEENQLLWCNPQACRLLGIDYSSNGETAHPRLLLELVRSYELDSLIDQTRQRQQPCTKEWMLYRVSPDPFHPRNEPTYPLRGFALPLDKGKVAVFLENRQEAITLIQQRDRWTSDVAHELKTPLTSIRLVAETLKSRVDPSLQGWMDRLLNETIRLSNLVEDLLNLSRLEGKDFQGLNLKRVNFPQLIEAAWISLEPLAKVKQLSLTYEGPDELLITLDESLMHRVLINLIDNAIKHSPPRSSVYVWLSEGAIPSPDNPSGQVCLEVADTGAGFLERDLPYIFDRFYRADPSRHREDRTGGGTSGVTDCGGTGLGLAIVQQILTAHQGTIEAKNHPDLGGGWLQIYLPGQLLVSEPSQVGNSPL